MLADQIQADIKTAMRSGAALKLSVLRMISSECNYKKIDVQHDLTDADIVTVLQKEAKKRREAIDAYQKAGRTESAAQEAEELAIIEAYLPAQLSAAEIEAEMGDLSRFASFTDAMKELSPKFRGRADGGVVAGIVKQHFGA